jgi:hypothetical protein
MTGTSMASPAVTGAAALARQYYEEGFYPTGRRWAPHGFTPTGSLLKATLLVATVDMTGIAGYPSNLEGWGRLLLDDALHFAGDARRLIVRDVRHAQGLSTGDVETVRFRVQRDLPMSLKIALAWADVPAEVNTDYAPVNDLHLEVESPYGQIYHGNGFIMGESSVYSEPDHRDNAEMFLLNAPLPGLWTVRVRGGDVPEGPQGWALAVAGRVQEVGLGEVNGGAGPLLSSTNESGDPDIPEAAHQGAPGAAGAPSGPWVTAGPNPFNPTATLRWSVPVAGPVVLRIFDLSGRAVRTLVDGEAGPGTHETAWHGTDDFGRPVTSGVYFYRLETESGAVTGRMALIR